MRGADGKTYTSYWNVSQDDRAVMVDAMQEDGFLSMVRANREILLDILNNGDDDDEDGDDGLQEADTDSNSTG